MKTIKYSLLNNTVMLACIAIIIMSGCDQTENDNFIPSRNENPSGELIDISISLQEPPEYSPSSDDTPATRSVKPLVHEYVKLNTFSATRSPEESDNPNLIGLMELSEDTVSAFPLSRGTMVSKAQFRLIAFRKEANGNYVYQTDAVYEDSGADVPKLISGKMLVPLNQTYRFVAYSYNKAASIWSSMSYVWNSTSVPIPDLSNDFLTFDSGDKTVSGATYQLPVTFKRELSRLTVTVVATTVGSDVINNCTGVYIKEGGNSSSWVLGAVGITPNTSSSAAADFSSNSGSFNLVPFANSRPITVHFNAISVDGISHPDLEFQSQQSVQLLAGKSYNLKIRIKGIGIRVPASDINLGGTGCTSTDKQSLSKLIWADGNLKGWYDPNPYNWAPTQSDYGYYYIWNSIFGSMGNTIVNNTDPCTKLDVDKYGSGWRTPTKVEFEMLSRCSDKVFTNGGMWFMNNPDGLFLPAAGYRNLNDGSGAEGSGYTGTTNVGTSGYYWSSTAFSDGAANLLSFDSGYAYITGGVKALGFSVRCVK